jgi:hypothetical protein
MMSYRNLINPVKLGTVTRSAATLGTMGAVLGGTISAIGNTYQVARGEKKGTEAIANVAKETVGSGLSTATAAATMAALGIGGLIGLAGFAAVASITKGLLDSVLYCEEKRSTSNP